MTDETPYTRDEVLRYSNEPPTRGLFCPKCSVLIPQFRDLNEADEKRVWILISSGRSMMAMEELRVATGCSPAWAEIWVEHRGRPEFDRAQTAPCPYCGKTLRTPLAKQCPHCFMDWHDRDNPGKLRSVGESGK